MKNNKAVFAGVLSATSILGISGCQRDGNTAAAVSLQQQTPPRLINTAVDQLDEYTVVLVNPTAQDGSTIVLVPIFSQDAGMMSYKPFLMEPCGKEAWNYITQKTGDKLFPLRKIPDIKTAYELASAQEENMMAILNSQTTARVYLLQYNNVMAMRDPLARGESLFLFGDNLRSVPVDKVKKVLKDYLDNQLGPTLDELSQIKAMEIPRRLREANQR